MFNINKKVQKRPHNRLFCYILCYRALLIMRTRKEIQEVLDKLTRILKLTPDDISIKIQKETLEWVMGKNFNS